MVKMSIGCSLPRACHLQKHMWSTGKCAALALVRGLATLGWWEFDLSVGTKPCPAAAGQTKGNPEESCVVWFSVSHSDILDEIHGCKVQALGTGLEDKDLQDSTAAARVAIYQRKGKISSTAGFNPMHCMESIWDIAFLVLLCIRHLKKEFLYIWSWVALCCPYKYFFFCAHDWLVCWQ